MLGFDEDDRNTFEDLYDFIQCAHIDLPIINLLIPVPGTTIFKRFQNEGRLFIEDEAEFIEKSPLYCVPNNHCLFTPKNMTAQEAETHYLRLVSRVSTLPAILRRSLLPNPFMAVISFFINYYFRTEYKLMTKNG